MSTKLAPVLTNGAANTGSHRPWGLGVLLLVAMGALFFSSYGLANWLASQRSHVPYYYYEWERNIPFVPWTIIPYWSIDLLYGVSFFLWRTRADLITHAMRLLAAQGISVACFIAFPMRFAFERPVAGGLPGQLFTLLGGFDKPFNQTPSLHITLLVILWVAYGMHCPARWRWLLHGWFGLIGVSVLTTYQHHVIDVFTGWLVGWWCVFVFPMPAARLRAGASEVPISGSLPELSVLARRYSMGAGAAWLLSLVALRCSVTVWLLLVWVTLAMLCVAWVYRSGRPEGFGKAEDGSLSMAAWWTLVPYILVALLNSRWWTRQHDAVSKVTDRLWIGRVPTRNEIEVSGADALLDLTAELPRLADVADYHCIPMLDLVVPTREQLRAAVRQLGAWHDSGKTILVSCALGYSRSALVVACWLAAYRGMTDVREVLELLRTARPVVLGPASVSALEWYIAEETP